MASRLEQRIEDLKEELTIQQVLLSSLDDQTFDGVGVEKEIYQAKITQLKQLMGKARDGTLTEEEIILDTDALVSDEPSPLDSPGFMAILRDAPYPAGPMENLPPLENTGNEPRQVSLPTRKRDRDEDLSHPNKVQRTTPAPTPQAAPAFSSSPFENSQNYDVIDLTGSDNEIDPDFVAAQKREEERRQQEKADRAFAERLSSQTNDPGEPGPSSRASASSSRTPSGSQAQRTLFTRMMEAQRANDAYLLDDDWEPWPLMPGDFHSSTYQPLEPASGLSMPGAFDPTWNQQNNPAISVPGPSQPQNQTTAMVAQPRVVPELRQPAMGHLQVANPYAATAQSQFQTAGQVHNYNMMNGTPPAFQPRRTLTPVVPQPRHPLPPPARPNPLSDIINRTSGYDYTNGVDQDGNALPEHLTSFINDVVHDTRVSEQELDDLLQNIHPDMELPERGKDGTPQGLKGRLYHHQEIALTWLKKIEEGTNQGGVLADDMGLGKTISMISLMLSRPGERPKTNLIIGPVALLRQWEEEIRDKVLPSHRMSVFVHHGAKKYSCTADDLLRYDVVLTTYMTLAAEHKRMEKLIESSNAQDRQIDYNDRELMRKFPLLHPKAKFYRIILDEAQCIKNKMTRSAKACHQLKGTYRWCLSGTPMMNGVDELYSLIAFLKIKPYCHWERFRKAFGTLFGKRGDAKSVAMERMRVLLKAIMLRRKKDSKIDGKPILRLPEKKEEVVHVRLNDDERDFYSQLEQKSQVLFNKYLREGSVGKNYSHILVLLLRLRQACCHPHLNLDVHDTTPASDAGVQELVEKLDANIVSRIKEMDMGNIECPICYDAVQSPSFFIPCGHDSCQQCLARLIDSATASNIQEGIDAAVVQAKCPVCRGNFDPSKCFSYDTFQKVHMPKAVADEEEVDIKACSDLDFSDSFYSDDGDSNEVDKQGNLRGFIVNDEAPDSEDESKDKPAKTQKKKKKNRKNGKAKEEVSEVRPSMLKALRLEANKNRAAHQRYMGYLNKTWLPSAKVTQCMDLLKEIQETGEKTIIFSQWTLLLDLIEVSMKHEGFASRPVRYDGGMSANERNDAAHMFRTNRDTKVILVSLKAGNAGLNLADASRVIILDPFWNPYIEMQAVDRAYRIGQQREVFVYRILTQDTVEDRIVELQLRKKEMVEAALDEAAGRKISRLSANELKFLFNGRSR